VLTAYYMHCRIIYEYAVLKIMLVRFRGRVAEVEGTKPVLVEIASIILMVSGNLCATVPSNLKNDKHIEQTK